MVKIGIVGTGTIGSGTISILLSQRELIKKRSGIDIQIAKVCDLDTSKAESLGIEKSKLTNDYKALVQDKEVEVIIELIGGYEPARTFILQAIEAKKHVVTANKAVLARHGIELFEAAKKNNVNIMFEAAVGGAIPIIKPLQESYVSEDITSMYGILNGTTNYVLTRMKEGMPYERAVKKAQDLGFAEADPGFDVEGKDAAQKLSILASIVFNTKVDGQIPTNGITDLTDKDLAYARELGYEIRLLAIAKDMGDQIELRVHPTMIPLSHGLCSVSEEINALYISGKNIGSVLLSGPGAGKLPTATVVVGDAVEIARRIECKSALSPVEYFKIRKVKPIQDIESRYYIRFTVEDKPGVLAAISKVIGEHGISISGVSQKEEQKPSVPVIITTHKAKEKDMMDALEKINSMDITKEKAVVVRIEDFS